MSGHGWVTPNPDGSKAKCGGPGLCRDCSAEAITPTGDLTRREQSAADKLNRIGLHLEKPGYGGYVVTDKPRNACETVFNFPAIEDVEKLVAEWTVPEMASAAAPVKLIETQPYVAAMVHYVSHGSPVRADGSQAFKSVCRAAVVAEVSGEHKSRDGVLTPLVTLCVLNPSGIFFQPGMQYDPGTFTGPEREACAGEPLPLITCDDLTFQPGTWHWAGR
jgi:hypothetical protein